MINVLFCGEGVADYGYKIYNKDSGRYIQQDGPLQIFMRNSARDANLNFIVKKNADLKKIKVLVRSNITATRLAFLAERENCTHIAYHRDEDNKGLKTIREQVEGYFYVAELRGIKCIAIVPQHMTESWLLADKGSFPSIPIKPPLPKKPEETWGAPESPNHPKKYIKDVLDQFNLNATADTFAEISNLATIETLREKCPASFEPFYQDMQKFVAVEGDA